MAIETPVEIIGGAGCSPLFGWGSWITFGSYGDFPVNLPDFQIPWLLVHRRGSRPVSRSSFRYSRWKHRAALRGLSTVWPAAQSLSLSLCLSLHPPFAGYPAEPHQAEVWVLNGGRLWHCLCSGEEDRFVNHGLVELAFVSLVSLHCRTFSLVSSTVFYSVISD